jgi:hypothetical protein
MWRILLLVEMSQDSHYQAMLTALSGNLILVGRRLDVEVLNHSVLQGDVNLT